MRDTEYSETAEDNVYAIIGNEVMWNIVYCRLFLSGFMSERLLVQNRRQTSSNMCLYVILYSPNMLPVMLGIGLQLTIIFVTIDYLAV